MQPKRIKKAVQPLSTDHSVMVRASIAIRRLGMGVMVLMLGMVGINGFAATAVNCPDRGILDYVKIAGGAWGRACDAGLPDKSIGAIVGSVIQVFLGLLGLIFLILTLYAGFLWMTAAGEKDKVKKAQDLLKAAVIGLFIIIAAQGLTYWILSVIAGAVSGTK